MEWKSPFWAKEEVKGGTNFSSNNRRVIRVINRCLYSSLCFVERAFSVYTQVGRYLVGFTTLLWLYSLINFQIFPSVHCVIKGDGGPELVDTQHFH